MARKDYYAGDIHSEKGFYIGDICYALSEEVYRDIWGKQNRYADGVITDPVSGFQFAVGSTAYGDGVYEGTNGFAYGVDAGVIGIVPLELVEKETIDLGSIHEGAGYAHYQFEDGHFEFRLPCKEFVMIETHEEEEDDDSYWEDNGFNWLSTDEEEEDEE